MPSKLNILIFFLLFAKFGFGQCVYSEEIPIQDLTENNFALIVSGATNNDLSDPNQGVCGIQLNFNHEAIGDLSITLTSPSGQTITLVGPTGVFENTFFTTWDISFTRCENPAIPDAGFADIYSNNQMWGVLGNYTGTYYPFNGCLEDFNTGPVNGNWTIGINDGIQFGEGNLLSISLIFCDPTGVSCEKCEADAGYFGVTSFELCELDPNLDLNLDPIYDNNPPDNSDFSYTYVISQNGIITAYAANSDMSNAAVGNYTICGLSVLNSDLSNLPIIDGTLTLNQFQEVVDGSNQLLCTDLTPDCATLTINPQPGSSSINAQICQGQSYQVGNESFDQSGSYMIAIPVNDCDSIVNLELTVIDGNAELSANSTTISCNGSLILDASASNIPAGSSTEWYTEDGNFSSLNGSTATVSAPGTYFFIVSNANCTDTAQIIIDSDGSFPEAMIEPPILTCNSPPRTINLSVTQGTVNMFSWSGPNNYTSNLEDPEITEPGLYVVQLIDANGCINYEGVEVQFDNSVPDLSFTYDNLTCYEPVTTILVFTTDEVSNFSWSGPNNYTSNAQNPNILEPGTYYLESQGINGCIRRDTIDIISNLDAPVITAEGGTIVCNQTSFQLSAMANIDGSDFNWSGPSNFTSSDPNPFAVVEGTYCVTVTSPFGCVNETCVEVDRFVSDFDVDITVPDLGCNEASTQFNLTTDAIGPSFRWVGPNSFSSNLQNPFAIYVGAYLVTVTDNLGCTQVDTIQVSHASEVPDIPHGTGGNITCDMDSILVFADIPDGYIFSWTGPNGITSDQDSFYTYERGDYVLNILDPNTNCSANYISAVGIDTFVTPINISTDILDCNVLQSDLTLAENPRLLDVSWSGPGNFTSNSFSNNVSIPGYYTYTINSNNGCQLTDSIEIIGDYEPPSINLADQIIPCGFDSIRLTVIDDLAELSFDWTGPLSFSSNDPRPYASEEGQYNVIVTGPNGCSSVGSFNLSIDKTPPELNILGNNIIDCSNSLANLEMNSSSNDISYEWIHQNVVISTDSTISVIDPGSYTARLLSNFNNCVSTETVDVIIDQLPPDLSLSGEALSCNIPNPQLLGETTAMSPQYAWTGPNNFTSNLDAIQPVEGGWYTLELTGQNSCITTDSILFEIDTIPPDLTLWSADTLSCQMSSIQLGVETSDPANATFGWVGPSFFSTEQYPFVDQSGMYTVQITGENGCTSVADIEVFQNMSLPDISISGESLSCQNTMATLTGSSSTQGITYSWMGPTGYISDEAEIMISDSGTYTLDIIAMNGCIATETFFVDLDNLEPGVTTADGTLPCNGDPIILNSNSNTPNVSYSWSGPSNFTSNLQNPEVSIPGVYTVTATGENGCQSFADAMVNTDGVPPVFDAIGDTITCYSPIGQLLGIDLSDDLSFEWTGVNFQSFLENPEITEPGTYTLTVTGQNGCTDEKDVIVEIDTLAPIAIALFNDVLACEKNTAELDGTNSSMGPEFEYNWTAISGNIVSGDNSTTPIIDAAGTYSLEVININNGCSTLDMIEVDELIDDIKIETLVINHPGCGNPDNGEISVEEVSGGTEPYTYAINDGLFSSSKDFGSLSPGQYMVSVQDQLGCRVDTTIEINKVEEIIVDLGTDIEVNLGESTEISATINIPFEDISSLEWTSNGELPCTDCLSFTVTPLITTYYQLLVVDTGGCTASDEVMVRVESDPEVFIPNVFSPNNDGINDKFIIEADELVEQINTLHIFDRWGSLVYYSENFNPGEESSGWDGNFKGSHMNPGVYAYIVEIQLINGDTLIKKGDVTLLK